MNIIRVFKLGSYYKVLLISDREQIEKNLHNKNENIDNNSKRLNNVIRAKTNITNLILCNDFKYFYTQTLDSKYNREDLDFLRSSFNQKVKDLRKKYKLDLKYIIIAERHKKGGWHLHGVLNKNWKQLLNLNQNGYLSVEELAYLGFNSIDKIRDKRRIANYVTKYITKDFINREKGKHCYFCSKGLNRPIVVMQKIDDGSSGSMEFDFSNEYCSEKLFDNITDLLQFFNFPRQRRR